MAYIRSSSSDGGSSGSNTIYDTASAMKNSTKTYDNVKNCFATFQNSAGQTTCYMMVIIQNGSVKSETYTASSASYSYNSSTHKLTLTWSNSSIGVNLRILYDQY